MPDLISEPELQAKFAFTYLMPEITSPYTTFCIQVLSMLLFEGPNSPMYQALIEADLGPNYCSGYGIDTTTRQATFTVGLSNVKDDEEHFLKIEEAILGKLEEVSKTGIETKFIETVLHQLEFSAKRTRQHFGLMMISSMIPNFIHGGDPLSVLKVHEYCAKFREDLKNEKFIQMLV